MNFVLKIVLYRASCPVRIEKTHTNIIMAIHIRTSLDQNEIFNKLTLSLWACMQLHSDTVPPSGIELLPKHWQRWLIGRL